MIKLFVERLAELLFPPKCVFCGKLTESGYGPCAGCRDKLPLITGEVCSNCGLPHEDCTCRGRKHLYVRRIAPAYYEGEIQRAIMTLKFYDFPNAALPLAELMAKSVREQYQGILFDCIVCVPMTPEQKRRRGYNQAELLGRELSKLTGIPYAEDFLRKTRETKIQHSLSAKLRCENVRGAFRASKRAADKCILLVDDIATTGATLSACADALLERGAAEVYCVCAAAVPKQGGIEANFRGNFSKNLPKQGEIE